jgi:hypothetical protein
VKSSEITRYVTWVVVGLFAYALVSEVSYKNKPAAVRTLSEGQDVDVAITLVSTDAKTLFCAHPEEIKGRHCEFATRTERWSKPSTTGRPPAADQLAPYKTTDDILLLVPGLFLDPALRDRLAIDPPNLNQEHIRFVANCKMHVDGKMDEIDVRWSTNGPWLTQKDAWYGPVSGCWLSDG